MTFKEGYVPVGAGSFNWMKNIEYKLSQVVAGLLLLFVVFVVWQSPPSFLSNSSVSASQSQTFFSSPASNEYTPASTSSESTPAVPTVDTDSHSAEQDSEPKKRPTPDPQQRASPVNNTTIDKTNATSDVFAEEDTKPVEEPAVPVSYTLVGP